MITKEQAEIWANVKANSARLKGCRGHNFGIDLTPEKVLGKQWQCIRCLGTVDTSNKVWYEEGVRDGRRGTGVANEQADPSA